MIQTGDILSGRTLKLSFPNNMTISEDTTIISGTGGYSIVATVTEDTYEGATTTLYQVVLKNSENYTVAFFFARYANSQTPTVNATTYTLPDTFYVVDSVDADSTPYQYIVANMGTVITSDTIDMAVYSDTHDDAARTATNYLSWISQQEGLVISESPVTDITQVSGGNTRINSSGMRIYDGTKKVADFGQNVVIGDSENKNVRIGSTEVKMRNETEDYFVLNMDGEPEEAYVSTRMSETFDNDRGEHTVTLNLGFTKLSPGDRFFASFHVVETAYTFDISGRDFIYGTAQTTTLVDQKHDNREYVLDYDGVDTITYTGHAYTLLTKWDSYVRGTYYIPASSLSYGANSRNTDPGGYSSCFGYNLSAVGSRQTVIGEHNKEDEYSQFAFIIGNGEVDTPSNGFMVRWSGTMLCKNIQVGYNTDGMTVPAGGYYDYSVDFRPFFDNPPIVIPTLYSSSKSGDIGLLSIAVVPNETVVGGCTVRIFNAGQYDRAPYFGWIAVDMTDYPIWNPREDEG